MARELRRLLIDPARLAPELALRPEEIRYLTRVLRYGPGDRVELTDGAGGLWSASLIGKDRLALEQPLGRPLRREPPPALRLELAIAVPKRDMDLVVRMACELGVDRLQPLRAENSALVGSQKNERWEAILREASEQCERLWLPELAPPEPAGPWLGAAAQGGALRLLSTTRQQGLPLLGEVLSELGPRPPATLTLACGPEGGWSGAEEVAASASGWRFVSLGPRILRCSTAAVAGLAVLDHWRAGAGTSRGEDWGENRGDPMALR
ncbi:16S rRNA (uracil(1498)-N(3))-methyltransferase [Cyanobium sp. Morenito 9A2]|uniref:16S rRNA (uracil(1498)-N(3))-methyltransferase n=1 Tax=Cyanobium sp. Morenito 9A2 TaxID=2823718 RepID=UPI0020CBB5B4|nr:16S rRNA (uracil(1498)-N(3))-methyltransferase [Cyanobium sp. Morenito 9A2]MCP9850745.1 16S rRNA (uracil(1498)-N(3))-methyltransferase [Cyanobium sp. Morenito 9A2]